MCGERACGGGGALGWRGLWLQREVAAEGGGAHARCVREVSRDVGRAALTGSALSIFDVLSSAFGVLAPLYNGFFLGRLGVSAQPLVACVHYTIIFAVAYLTLADPAAAKNKQE